MKLNKIKSWLCVGPIIALLCASLSPKTLSAPVCDVESLTCSIKIQTSWVTPVNREDGSALAAQDISKYQIVGVQASGVDTIPSKNVATCGQCWDVAPNDTSAVIQGAIKVSKADVIDDGKASVAVAIRTFDVQNQMSEWSELVYVDVPFPEDFITALTPLVKKTQLLNVVVTFE